MTEKNQIIECIVCKKTFKVPLDCDDDGDEAPIHCQECPPPFFD